MPKAIKLQVEKKKVGERGPIKTKAYSLKEKF